MPKTTKDKTTDGKNQDQNTKFLEAWRSLELLLRDDNKTVQDYENTLSYQNRDTDASRLRICRQIRNFLVHDGTGFVAAAAEMTRFVEDLATELQRAKGTARTTMMSVAKYGYVTPGETTAAAARVLLNKHRDSVLVLDTDKKLLGAINIMSLATAISENTSAGMVRTLVDRYNLDTQLPVVHDDTPVANIPDTRCVVQNSKGQCIGVVNAGKAWR